MGATTPPYMGPNIATEIILNSKLKSKFNLIHIDTSDHRDLSTLGALDFHNFYLAIKHYLNLLGLVITQWPSIVYMPISQTTIGYFRDAIFILLPKIFCRKVVCHLRGGYFKNWYNSANLLTRWLVRNIHSLVDGQIVLGENLRNLFDGILPKEKIFVVPNGIDLRICSRKKEKSDKVDVFFLSNFSREKGILDVLNAVPEVCSFTNKARFIFAGNCAEQDIEHEIKAFLNKYVGLPIDIKGAVFGRAKLNLLTSSDIFVFPTYYPFEGHPWVIVEAMAAGLPIITTDQGAITESVKDGVNGFIIEKKSPKQIAGKIKFLIDNPVVRKKMGEESHRLYLENFTESKMIERLSCVFYSVLSK